MPPLRILIADDHLIIRQGLRLIFETVEDFELVGEAEDGNEALRLCAERRFFRQSLEASVAKTCPEIEYFGAHGQRIYPISTVSWGLIRAPQRSRLRLKNEIFSYSLIHINWAT